MIKKKDFAVRFHKWGFQTEEHVVARSARDAVRQLKRPYQGIWTKAEVFDNNDKLKAVGKNGRWQYV